MDISSNLTEQEIIELQNSFYDYFESGYAFEEFLREYLQTMGLDEVEVTQRSRDGGIDLMAIRKGVGDFSDIDKTQYKIQAKRYKPTSRIAVSKIRELKGVIPSGCKGMFITTASFSADAITEAANDESRPVVIIDGKSLVMSCIDNGIGFLFKPIFSKKRMDEFVGSPENDSHIGIFDKNMSEYVEKTITQNDIRARIISIPTSIITQIPIELDKIDVLVNGEKQYYFTIIRGRNYFAGVTQFLREYNLLSEEGVIHPCKSKWLYDMNSQVVKIFVGR